MFTASDVTESETIHIIDPEEPTETARLMLQNSLLQRYMGSPLSMLEAHTPLQRILDLASGPGGWVLDTAFAHPQTTIIGIDRSETNIRYARAQAKAQHRQNAYFQTMDILQPLRFSNNYFDLVHARFLNTFLPTPAWNTLLHECFRVTRPGGSIILTECDYGITSSLACEKLSEYYAYALRKAGLRSSPVGRTLVPGQSVLLDDLLYESGYRIFQHKTHLIDFSAEEEDSSGMVDNALIFLRLIKPFLLNSGVLSVQEFEDLYNGASQEMRTSTFCGQWLIEVVWGKKCPHK
jgi:SAM-dependent methyltransferase